MAFRAGRSWYGWALGGALFALVTSTIVLGVSHAMFLPMSRASADAYQIKSLAVTLVVVLALGWLLTISLHRHPHLIFKALKKRVTGAELE